MARRTEDPADHVGPPGEDPNQDPARQTSHAQVQANRRNGRKSTGPKSKDGKRRASRNAIKHSAYAAELYPIDRGPLSERESEFRLRAEQLLEGFKPQDALEAELAKRAVKALMSMARLDRFEALLVNQHGVPDRLVEMAMGDLSEAEDDLYAAEQLVNMVRLDKDDELPTNVGLDCGDFDYLPEDWERIAPLVRRMAPNSKIKVKDLWTDDETPSTPAEWASAVRAIWKHCWPDHEDRLNWAVTVKRATNIAYLWVPETRRWACRGRM